MHLQQSKVSNKTIIKNVGILYMITKYKRTKAAFKEIISDIIFRIIVFIPNVFNLIIRFFKSVI